MHKFSVVVDPIIVKLAVNQFNHKHYQAGSLAVGGALKLVLLDLMRWVLIFLM